MDERQILLLLILFLFLFFIGKIVITNYINKKKNKIIKKPLEVTGSTGISGQTGITGSTGIYFGSSGPTGISGTTGISESNQLINNPIMSGPTGSTEYRKPLPPENFSVRYEIIIV